MADQKLTALTALTTPTSDDIFYIVDDPSGTPASKKITFANLQIALGGIDVVGEVVSGSGTSFTLANTPITGSVKVYGDRNRLYPSTDYSITGAVITTVLSYSTGDILADYKK